VNNNILPAAPGVSINSSTPGPRNTNSISIDLNTGISFVNCTTFSHLAVTETATPPGILQFNIDCTNSGSQTETIVYSSGDGAKTLYVWAIDNEGQISSASSVSFVVDSLPPVASITSIASELKGGSTEVVTIAASDAGVGLSNLDLYFSSNGGTSYSLLSHLSTSATTYSWTVPSINTTTAKLKLVATDFTASTTIAYSNLFTIDSTAPSAPTLARTSANYSNSTNVAMTVGSCSDTASILMTESATAPSATAAGWVACSTTVAATTSTVSGEGAHNLYAWAKDLAGNVASSANHISMTLDTTAPTVAVTTPSGQLKGGNSITLNYSASDTNTISSLQLAYAADGVTFGAPTSLTVGSSSTSWTVNSDNVVTAKLKIIATDSAGNISSAITSAFVIDSTAPSVAVTTPTGPLKGGNSITINYSASDTNTITSLQLAYAADGTTFGTPITLTVGSTSASWTVNASDVSTAKLKITATDTAGNIGAAMTSAFTV
jgi:hypothetical protein